jgi:hypothetical protein
LRRSLRNGFQVGVSQNAMYGFEKELAIQVIVLSQK